LVPKIVYLYSSFCHPKNKTIIIARAIKISVDYPVHNGSIYGLLLCILIQMALKVFWFVDSFLDVGNSTLSDQPLGLREIHRIWVIWQPLATLIWKFLIREAKTNTPSVPNYKSFQESWRVKIFQVWPNLYDKIITFMIPIKYH